MGVHHGPDEPDPISAAAVDDAARVLLAVWDSARGQASVRLSWSQLAALLAVERDEAINLRGLAGRLRMILSSASRLCDRLVAAGLLERVPGRADRREIALFLTPSSRQLLKELRAAREEMLAKTLARMSSIGRAALLHGLAEFAAASVRDPALHVPGEPSDRDHPRRSSRAPVSTRPGHRDTVS
jgi:DNA-binding MarR family transcriptional regulator